MPSLSAISPPAFEATVAQDIKARGFEDAHRRRGGVAFMGNPYRANLILACPTRILQRVARFKALTFAQFERGVREMDWAPFGELNPKPAAMGLVSTTRARSESVWSNGSLRAR